MPPIPTPPDFVPRPCRPRREGGGVRWRVWAPRAGRVELLLPGAPASRRVPLEEEGGGYFTVALGEGEAPPGARYGYSLDGGPVRPDPCSLHQPGGVHRPSALHFPGEFPWRHVAPGIEVESLVIYELHVGAFTAEGTFDAAAERLGSLAELGVTAVELLPVAQFPGARNWGYDGVHPFAAQDSYGGPAGLQRFVDAAHGLGLAVILDAVFNHLGPEGNYLPEFGPYFSRRSPTPWGPGFRFEGRGSRPVRDWVLECAAQWIHDFRCDGLRLDAVHAIRDGGRPHLLTEIKETADRAAAARGGTAFLIAESLRNDASVTAPSDRGGLGLDAEWNEDFHHAVAAWMTGERHGKYADYGPLEAVETVFRDTFHLAGRESRYYGGPWGRPAGDAAGSRFVVSLQNHDHVGNRAGGERLASLTDEARLRLGACLTLLAPFVPMLFMGEEYGETNPFLFFCSFGDEGVAEAVRRGRRRDFELAEAVPDPQDEETFWRSRLSWDWEGRPGRARLRGLHRELIALRLREPALRDLVHKRVRLEEGDSPLLMLERGAERELVCCFHCGGGERDFPPALRSGKPVWRSGGGGEGRLGPFETAVLRMPSGADRR